MKSGRRGKPLEDYALIGDRRSAALVARDGSIDWLCWPRFDSDACFAALLGDERHGRWLIAPSEPPQEVRRHYRRDTLILETRYITATGTVCLIDLMPVAGALHPALIRRVVGEAGSVSMTLDLALRFDYGSIPPWLKTEPRIVTGVAGPDLVAFRSPVDLQQRADRIGSVFPVRQGEQLTFLLQYGLAHQSPPEPLDCDGAIAATERYWQEWIDRFGAPTDWPAAVKRSLLTLRALTHVETGGMVAAPTASLPEVPGGEANWDYRYTWLRDGTFAICAFLNAGYHDAARAWRDWLLRAAAGVPGRLQPMYRFDAARHVGHREISWLPGHAGAQPVHIGNAAAGQFQLDIWGEVLDALYLCAQAGLDEQPWEIAIEQSLAAYIGKIWRQPDQGIWEARGPARHLTYSKAMAWAGIDRFLKLAGGRDGLGEARRREFRQLRDDIHKEICAEAFSPARNSFVAAFGSDDLDASLLLLPIIGFLPIEDPRIAGTIKAIEAELVEDGLVRRRPRSSGTQDRPFLACTCWLADCLGMQGRKDAARAYLECVLALANDVGLLSEEWDPRRQRMTGNFPQGLSHLAVVNTALGLCGPVLQRGGG